MCDDQRMRRGFLVGIWLAGVALCATLTIGAIRGGWPPTEKAVISYAAALVAITIGLVVWRRRPDTRTGILLTAYAFAGIAADLWFVFPESALAVTIGFAMALAGAPILVHTMLSYPTGRLTDRLERGFVVVAYAFAVVYVLPHLLFYDPRAPFDPDVWDRPFYARPLTHVAWYDVSGVENVLDGMLLVLAVVLLALLVRKLVRATPAERGIVLPLVVASLFVVTQFVVQLALYGEQVNSWISSSWFWIVTVAGLAVPLSLAAGLLWGRTARSAVADLVVELERTPPGSVRDALARTLGDPSLELLLWLPDRGSYVDGRGTPHDLPAGTARRAVSILGPDEAPVAALVHDPALLERPALLEAAGAATRLALENERLHAELRLQLEEVRASRARIITAGDEERRRLERDLHDGAQQRLLGIGLALSLARSQLGPEANGAADLLAEADAELRATLDELRELARGIHPALLTEQGLGAALETLAERSPVPVSFAELPQERLPAPAEAAAYFLVSEALVNVTKHAHASRVRVSAVRRDGRVLVDVDDDGVGGADPGLGSGLRGLVDRLSALDGVLEVESAPGQGTHLHAEIPCA
jgi:signal transduction histidine kinase